MSTDTFRGVLTIPSTPFKQNGDVDWGDLKRVLDFCITCGAHGIVWPVNASSFPVLTDRERLHGMQMVVEHTAGRVPVILGVQGASGHHAAMFARHAQALKADGVIAMAPYIEPIEDEDAMVRYYQDIDREVDMPIFIQKSPAGQRVVNRHSGALDQRSRTYRIRQRRGLPPDAHDYGLNRTGRTKIKRRIWRSQWPLFTARIPARRSRTNAGLSHNRCRSAPVECSGGWRFKRGKTGIWHHGTIVCARNNKRHKLSRNTASPPGHQKLAQPLDNPLSNSRCVRSRGTRRYFARSGTAIYMERKTIAIRSPRMAQRSMDGLNWPL